MKDLNIVKLNEWDELYKAAVQFYKIKCWEWLYETDLFGIQDPETGEIGYCCVLGNLEEVFALNLYIGTEGLDGYLKIYNKADALMKDIFVDYDEIYFSQKCLMASFEDRSRIDKHDMSIINKLGLQFKGRKSWPLFRSYMPGFVPWYLTAHEVRFLSVALKQTIQIALKIKEAPDLLIPPEDGQYFVQVFQDGKWENTWKYPAPYIEKKLVPEINEIALISLKRSNLDHNGIWEVDCPILPIVIKEGERPFHPYGLPILAETGEALFFEPILPWSLESDIPEKFMSTIVRLNYMPKTIHVGSRKAYDLLKPIAKELGIGIFQVENVPNVNFFLNGLRKFLYSQK